jgi:hypothetical protein
MEHTITLSEQTYRALQHQAARSQKAVDVLVEEWLKERLDLEPMQYHQIVAKSETIREARLVERETITLELPSDLYEGLRALSADEGIDPVQVIADLVKRAQQLGLESAKVGEASMPAGTSLLQQLANLAQDLGVEDLAEQHDHYLYGTEKR